MAAMNAMNRRGFLETGCVCGLGVLASPGAAPGGETAAQGDLTQAANPEQVMRFLKSVDRSGDESLRSAVFQRWGRECFYAPRLDQWALGHHANFDGFVASVNEGRSRYWEKIEYDKAAGTVKITSRKFPHCVCAWAQCQEPPKSLCTHCCRSFQTEIFRTMLDRKVDVEITESLLLGGERCRTTIHILAG